MRVLAVGMVFGVLLSWGARPGLAQESFTTTGSEALRQRVAEQLTELETRARKVIDTIDSSSFDIRVLGSKLQGVEAAFRHVRDLRFDVYHGALRGTVGTLIAGGGNSLDRSLLLAELLERQGRNVRIARGSLTDEQARRILDGRRTATIPPPSTSTPAAPEAPAADPQGLAILRRKQEEMKVRLQQATDQAGQDARRLEEALTAAGVSLETMSKGRDDRLVEILRDHFFVEMEVGDNWIVLDTALPDATVEGRLTATTGTFTADELPRDLDHWIVVRVIVEQLDGGKLQESVLLENHVSVRSIEGRSLDVSLVPQHADQMLENLGKQAPTLSAEDRFQPVLRLGDEIEHGRPFDLKGYAFEKLRDPLDMGEAAAVISEATSRVKLDSGLTSLAQDLSSWGDSAPASQPATLASVRLEIVQVSPGTPERRHRHDIVDRVGLVNRSSPTTIILPDLKEDVEIRHALIRPREILVRTGWNDPAYLAFLAVDSLQSRIALVKNLLAATGSGTPLDMGKLFDKLPPSSSQAAVILGTLETGGRALMAAATPASRLEGHGPDVAVLVGASRGEDRYGSDLSLVEAVDLMDHHALETSVTGQTPGSLGIPAAGAAALRAGALVSRLEGLAVGPARLSAVQAIDAALDEGASLRVIAPDRASEGLGGIEVSPAVRARLQSDLDAGHMVAVPTKPSGRLGRFGWWRLDVASARCLAILDSGTGGAVSLTTPPILHGAVESLEQMIKLVPALLWLDAIKNAIYACISPFKISAGEASPLRCAFTLGITAFAGGVMAFGTYLLMAGTLAWFGTGAAGLVLTSVEGLGAALAANLSSDIGDYLAGGITKKPE